MKMILLLITLVLIIAACSPTRTDAINDISVGMNKAEVIKILGKPQGSKAEEGRETLIYELCLSNCTNFANGQRSQRYHVVLESGKVISYSPVGGTFNPYGNGMVVVPIQSHQQPAYQNQIVQPTKNIEPIKIKQTDFGCVSDCEKAGYEYGLCQNRCSY